MTDAPRFILTIDLVDTKQKDEKTRHTLSFIATDDLEKVIEKLNKFCTALKQQQYAQSSEAIDTLYKRYKASYNIKF